MIMQLKLKTQTPGLPFTTPIIVAMWDGNVLTKVSYIIVMSFLNIHSTYTS